MASNSHRAAGMLGEIAQALDRLYDPVAGVQTSVDGLEQAAQLIADDAHLLFPGVEVTIASALRDHPGQCQVLGAAGRWASRLRGHEFDRLGTAHGEVMGSLHSVVLDSLDRWRDSPEGFSGGGIRRGRLVPLIAGEALPAARVTLGLIAFWFTSDKPPPPRDRRLIDSYGRLASLLLMRVEAWQGAARSESRLNLYRTISNKVQTSLDVVEVVERIAAGIVDVVVADRVTLSTLDRDGLTILISQDVEVTPAWTGVHHPMEAVRHYPAVMQAISSRRPVQSRAFDNPGNQMFAGELARAMHTVTVPLVVGQRVTGLIVLTRRTDRRFSDEEIDDLDVAASVAALAMHNAHLYSQSQAAARARAAFLNLAAHELRTPFGVIAGYLSLIEEGAFGATPDALSGPLQVIAKKSEELGRLIDQILDAARAETGRLVRAVEKLGLSAVVADAVRRCEPRLSLHEGNVTVMARAGPDVTADPGALATILDNLLNNAITYRRGVPRIEITLDEVRDDDGAWAEIRIADNGRGIPEHEQGRVFDQFHRAEIPGEPHPGGTGLGLYISHMAAAEMGGTLILVRSQVGEGSEFRLRLRLAAEPSASVETKTSD